MAACTRRIEAEEVVLWSFCAHVYGAKDMMVWVDIDMDERCHTQTIALRLRGQ